MLWMVVVVVGLGAELWVIIGLGRRATRRYEAEHALEAVGPLLSLGVVRQDQPAPRRAA
jgi:hypothetical protein